MEAFLLRQRDLPPIAAALLLALVLPVPAQQATVSALPSGTPRSWIEDAARNELKIINDDGTYPLRYRVRLKGAKGDMTREVIESRQGAVARLVEKDGRPLTHDEDAAERQRLEDILASPSDFIKHHKRDQTSRDYSTSLVKEMPAAMVWTYAAGQPQLPGIAAQQIVLDFEPDPKYNPPNMICDALTGIHGRVWIDARSRHVTRIQGSIMHTVNFGWGGVVAKINQGGTVEFEQTNAGGDRWVYSHLDEHITVKAFLVHTMPENNQMSAADFRLLPAPLSVEDAVHTLLAEQIPLR